MKNPWVGGTILMFLVAGGSRADIGKDMPATENLVRVAYAPDKSGNVMDTVHDTQGIVTDPVGGWDLFGSTPSDLYGWDGHGMLYALAHPAHAGTDGSQVAGSLGVSSASDHLFFMDDGALYQLDTRTGEATVVGPSVKGAANAENMSSFGPHTPAVLPSLPVLGPNGSDAASPGAGFAPATSDPPTVGAGFAPAGSDPSDPVIGFAPSPDPLSVVPEPRALSLFGAVLLGIVWTARRGQKRHAD